MRFVLLFTVMFLLLAVIACGGVGIAIYEANQTKAVEPVKTQPHVARRELIVFGGKWCQPCREMEPIVAGMEERHQILVSHIDPQEDKNTGAAWKIDGCPTFIVIEDTPYGDHGNLWRHEIGRFEGKMTLSELDRLIETGVAPLREPTQVLERPRPERQAEYRPVKSLLASIDADDPPRREREREPEQHRDERSTHTAAPAPKKHKPASCPCTFSRPSPWSIR